MALQDRVILKIFPPASALPRGPFVGTVVAEAAGPPATADVVWSNGKRTDGIDQTVLFKLFPPTDPDMLSFVGKWVQLLRWLSPFFAIEGEPPKSPAAAGIVHAMFGVAEYGESEPNAGFLGFMSLMDGNVPWLCVGIEFDQAVTQLTTQIQRRTIGRD